MSRCGCLYIYIGPASIVNWPLEDTPTFLWTSIHIELEEKPWGCVCKYCPETDTMYILTREHRRYWV